MSSVWTKLHKVQKASAGENDISREALSFKPFDTALQSCCLISTKLGSSLFLVNCKTTRVKTAKPHNVHSVNIILVFAAVHCLSGLVFFIWFCCWNMIESCSGMWLLVRHCFVLHGFSRVIFVICKFWILSVTSAWIHLQKVIRTFHKTNLQVPLKSIRGLEFV